jgi:hypothetical protein
MGHPTVVHEAEDGATEGEENIQTRQFGPHHQRDGRRRTVSLLQAGLGQQGAGKAMGKIIRHPFLSVLHTLTDDMIFDRTRGASWPAQLVQNRIGDAQRTIAC